MRLPAATEPPGECMKKSTDACLRRVAYINPSHTRSATVSVIGPTKLISTSCAPASGSRMPRTLVPPGEPWTPPLSNCGYETSLVVIIARACLRLARSHIYTRNAFTDVSSVSTIHTTRAIIAPASSCVDTDRGTISRPRHRGTILREGPLTMLRFEDEVSHLVATCITSTCVKCYCTWNNIVFHVFPHSYRFTSLLNIINWSTVYSRVVV